MGERRWVKWLVSQGVTFATRESVRKAVLLDLPEVDAVSVFASYLAALYRSGLKYGTVKNYSWAARALILHCGGPDLGSSLFLKGFLTCVRRLTGHDERPKMAVTAKFLLVVRSLLNRDTEAGMNVWCAILTAYAGLLRSAEYSVKRAGQFPPLIDSDLVLRAGKKGTVLEIRVRRSKNDQFSRGAVTWVAEVGGPLCAVTALHDLRSRWPKSKAKAAAFEEKPGRALRYATITRILKLAAVKAGINTDWVSTHSLRSGGASALARGGADAWIIQALGRWRSDAYQRYCRSPDFGEKTRNAARMLAHVDEDDKFIFDPAPVFEHEVTKDMIDLTRNIG